MHERNENQGNPDPTEAEQDEAATPRREEHDAMAGAGHEDPKLPAEEPGEK